jgi:glycosyltransferase involved in cell wall biosynthesis
LKQQTTFPFEIIIHDDASTDETAEIVREYAGKYPDLIFPIYQTENQYSKKKGITVPFVYPRTHGKYIAICEGDDYWTDEHKLQRQVDFLEANAEYGLVCTKAKTFVQKDKKFTTTIGNSKVKFEDILVDNPIITLTTLFRKDLLNQYLNEIDPVTKNWKMGDYPMWIYFAHESKIKFDNNITGVRRVLESSASNFKELSGKIAFLESGYDVSIFFLNKYSSDNIILSDSIIVLHMWMLFAFWCKSNTPELKHQIEHELKKVRKNNSLRMHLIQLTLKVPALRYLFFYYYKIRNKE